MDKERIIKLRESFVKAENEIKRTETEFNELPLPPINELRYSYNHFLRAITTDNGSEDNFRSAEKHVLRSIYDAVDVRIVSSLELIKSFQDEFRDVSIVAVIPKWIDQLNKAREVKDYLSSNDDGETRQERLKDHLRYADDLKVICDTCENSREELKKLIDAKVVSYRRFVTTIAITVLGILITIFLGILSLG